jgi:hypothetical protein
MGDNLAVKVRYILGSRKLAIEPKVRRKGVHREVDLSDLQSAET